MWGSTTFLVCLPWILGTGTCCGAEYRLVMDFYMFSSKCFLQDSFGHKKPTPTNAGKANRPGLCQGTRTWLVTVLDPRGWQVT